MSAVISGGHQGGVIGPNAILRLREALDADRGPDATEALFIAAGQAPLHRAPLTDMVDERAVARLHDALRGQHGLATATRIARRAGDLTADYLLAHRIPAIARWVLPWLPSRMSSRALVRAMLRHAWTFAGSGRVEAVWPAAAKSRHRDPPALRLELLIHECPLCRGARVDGMACEYYAATFERLFRRLVSPATFVREVDCVAAGGESCRFAVWW
jgi:divinyl protochlorophyllide a 8-vinyl-reductase